MLDVAELHAQALDATGHVVAGIAADRWHLATFGWEKALGDAAELAWWHDRAAEAAARRGIATGGAGG